MTKNLSRRGLMKASSAAVLGSVLPWDLAQAQVAGGVLRVGMTASAVPLSNGCPDQGAEGHRFMGITLYDQLVEWDLTSFDKPVGLTPGLATSWKVDPANPKRWIFTLREGVKFHDGKTMTADDVVFSYDRAFKKDAPWFDIRAAAQVSFRVPTIAAWGTDGPGIFWIETKVVDSTIPYCATWVGITHQGAWEAADKNWDTYLGKAVGTGPWKLESFNLRERCVMRRHEAYWDKTRITKSEQLVLLPTPEATTRVAGLRSGQLDFIEAPPPDAVPSLKAAGFQVITNTYGHNWTWQLSYLEGSPFRDLRVRKAINLAVDRSGMKELLGGLMEEGAGLLPSKHPWHGNPSFKLTFDPETAKKLLAEAGYGPGKPLKFKCGISTSGSGQMQPLPMNEFVQQNLKDVGVEVEFVVVDWNVLLGYWREMPSAHDIQAINVTMAALDPYTALIRALKSDRAPPNGNNWGHYSNAEADALCSQVYETFDAKAQDTLLIKLHELAVNDCAHLFVAHDLNPRALSPKTHGFIQAQSWFQDLTRVSVG